MLIICLDNRTSDSYNSWNFTTQLPHMYFQFRTRMVIKNYKCVNLYNNLCWHSKTRRWSNDDLMLAQRLRRRANIKTTLGQRPVFAGKPL